MLLTLVVSIGMSCVAGKLRQEEAVNEVRRLGGWVRYECEPRPGWPLNLPGRTFFSTVVEVDLSSTSVTDSDLERLTKEFTQLRRLHLIGTPVTDTGLKHLEGLTQLQTLELESSVHFTDGGLEQLGRLRQLDILNLDDTQVTDAGLEHLKGLTQLRMLGLTGTKVTDEGVKRLKQALPNCMIVH
jgi:Leucine-rich repeat (LRR) protein